jgi:hypothetical protein
MDWQPINEQAEALEVQIGQSMEASIQDAVRFVKEMAEHVEKQQAETAT